MTPNPNVVVVPGPGDQPRSSDAGAGEDRPAVLHLRGADATLERDDGSTQALDGTHLEVTAEGGFDLDGVDRVTTEALHVYEGTYHVPPQVQVEEMDAHHPEPPEEEMAESFYPGALHVEQAATLEDVTVHEASAAPGPDGGDRIGNGTLEVHEGRYLFKSSGMAVTLDEPLRLAEDDRARLVLAEPEAALNLYDQALQPRSLRLVVDTFDATITSSGTHVDLSADAVQWFEDDRPWFQASLAPSFEDVQGDETTARLELEPGDNATAWIELSETSNVATAPDIHPKVDAEGIEATFGYDWYDTPDPDLGDAIGSAIKNLVAGIFVDFSVTTLDPGEERYIPLIVHAPEDQTPGTYHVEAHFMGDNAKTDRLNATVTVR